MEFYWVPDCAHCGAALPVRWEPIYARGEERCQQCGRLNLIELTPESCDVLGYVVDSASLKWKRGGGA